MSYISDESTPARLAQRDQAIAESRDDLRNLVDYAAKGLRVGATADEVTDRIIRGLLASDEWDAFLLATVLGFAVVRLAEGEVA